MIEVSETMAKFLKFLADRRYTNRRGVIAEAIFNYYRDEWIEYKKMIEAGVGNE
jgi:predicted transcriptional regulator